VTAKRYADEKARIMSEQVSAKKYDADERARSLKSRDPS
jgi:hypothetical protein